MSFLLIFKNPKYLAGATWDILQGNQISKNFYLLFCASDTVITIYYSLMFLHAVHNSNVLLNGEYDS